jgi:hypothetical protein
MAEDRLFMSLDIGYVRTECLGAARKAVAGLTGPQLAESSEQLVQAIVGDKVPRQIVLDPASHWRSDQIVPIAMQQGLDMTRTVLPSNGRPGAEGVKVSLHIPYDGTRQAFTFRPSRMLRQHPVAEISDQAVVVSVTDASGEPAAVEKHLLAQEENLAQWVRSLNEDIARLEREVRGLVTSELAERLKVRRQRDELVAGLTIPARHVEPDRAMEIPVRRTAVILDSIPVTGAGSPEWRLADAVYEQMIKTITSFTHALERRPASAALLLPHEETLRDWLMFMLSTNYEAPDGSDLFVGGETVNGKGKTDILVRHRGQTAFIGECKFWDGARKFGTAINQLLDYTVWRDTKAAIILFITRRNATAVINSAAECLANHTQCRNAKATADPGTRRDFTFASPHDDQRRISIALLPVVVAQTS